MQTRLQSLIEVCVATTVKFCAAATLTKFMFGVSARTALWITCIYTASSIVLTYAVRRVFNRWHK